MQISVAGERLLLLAECAAFHPASATLLVADAHFGKAVAFRRHGVPVPAGTTAEMLQRLDTCLQRTVAQHIVFLGDLLHAKAARAETTMAAVARWRAARPALALSLVRGNHDQHAGDPPDDWQVAVHASELRLAGLVLRHDPEPSEHGYVLAGHVHPCAWVGGRGHDRLRLPCFHFGARVGVLPAFGGFTGMHALRREASDRVVVVAGDALRELPRAYTAAPA